MTPELWKLVVTLACVSLLTGLVLAVWLTYRSKENPFDIDEHDNPNPTP